MLAALATGAVDSVKTKEAAEVETDSSVGSVETFTDEDDEFTATLGAVHQAVLDNNVAKVGSMDLATKTQIYAPLSGGETDPGGLPSGRERCSQFDPPTPGGLPRQTRGL